MPSDPPASDYDYNQVYYQIHAGTDNQDAFSDCSRSDCSRSDSDDDDADDDLRRGRPRAGPDKGSRPPEDVTADWDGDLDAFSDCSADSDDDSGSSGNALIFVILGVVGLIALCGIGYVVVGIINGKKKKTATEVEAEAELARQAEAAAALKLKENEALAAAQALEAAALEEAGNGADGLVPLPGSVGNQEPVGAGNGGGGGGGTSPPIIDDAAGGADGAAASSDDVNGNGASGGAGVNDGGVGDDPPPSAPPAALASGTDDKAGDASAGAGRPPSPKRSGAAAGGSNGGGHRSQPTIKTSSNTNHTSSNTNQQKQNPSPASQRPKQEVGLNKGHLVVDNRNDKGKWGVIKGEGTESTGMFGKKVVPGTYSVDWTKEVVKNDKVTVTTENEPKVDANQLESLLVTPIEMNAEVVYQFSGEPPLTGPDGLPNGTVGKVIGVTYNSEAPNIGFSCTVKVNAGVDVPDKYVVHTAYLRRVPKVGEMVETFGNSNEWGEVISKTDAEEMHNVNVNHVEKTLAFPTASFAVQWRAGPNGNPGTVVETAAKLLALIVHQPIFEEGDTVELSPESEAGSGGAVQKFGRVKEVTRLEKNGTFMYMVNWDGNTSTTEAGTNLVSTLADQLQPQEVLLKKGDMVLKKVTVTVKGTKRYGFMSGSKIQKVAGVITTVIPKRDESDKDSDHVKYMVRWESDDSTDNTEGSKTFQFSDFVSPGAEFQPGDQVVYHPVDGKVIDGRSDGALGEVKQVSFEYNNTHNGGMFTYTVKWTDAAVDASTVTETIFNCARKPKKSEDIPLRHRGKILLHLYKMVDPSKTKPAGATPADSDDHPLYAGVEVYGKEYLFVAGAGIQARKLDTWKWMPGIEFKETVDMGSTDLSPRQVGELIKTLEDAKVWTAESYDSAGRNGNHFAEQLCRALGAKEKDLKWAGKKEKPLTDKMRERLGIHNDTSGKKVTAVTDKKIKELNEKASQKVNELRKKHQLREVNILTLAEGGKQPNEGDLVEAVSDSSAWGKILSKSPSVDADANPTVSYRVQWKAGANKGSIGEEVPAETLKLIDPQPKFEEGHTVAFRPKGPNGQQVTVEHAVANGRVKDLERTADGNFTYVVVWQDVDQEQNVSGDHLVRTYSDQLQLDQVLLKEGDTVAKKANLQKARLGKILSVVPKLNAKDEIKYKVRWDDNSETVVKVKDIALPEFQAGNQVFYHHVDGPGGFDGISMSDGTKGDVTAVTFDKGAFMYVVSWNAATGDDGFAHEFPAALLRHCGEVKIHSYSLSGMGGEADSGLNIRVGVEVYGKEYHFVAGAGLLARTPGTWHWAPDGDTEETIAMGTTDLSPTQVCELVGPKLLGEYWKDGPDFYDLFEQKRTGNHFAEQLCRALGTDQGPLWWAGREQKLLSKMAQRRLGIETSGATDKKGVEEARIKELNGKAVEKVREWRIAHKLFFQEFREGDAVVFTPNGEKRDQAIKEFPDLKKDTTLGIVKKAKRTNTGEYEYVVEWNAQRFSTDIGFNDDERFQMILGRHLQRSDADELHPLSVLLKKGDMVRHNQNETLVGKVDMVFPTNKPEDVAALKVDWGSGPKWVEYKHLVLPDFQPGDEVVYEKPRESGDKFYIHDQVRNVNIEILNAMTGKVTKVQSNTCDGDFSYVIEWYATRLSTDDATGVLSCVLEGHASTAKDDTKTFVQDMVATEPIPATHLRHRGQVQIHVYTLSRVWSSATGLGDFHAGVEVFGKEYYFAEGSSDSESDASGIRARMPKTWKPTKYRETIDMHTTDLSPKQVCDLVSVLGTLWKAKSYDLTFRNANHFAKQFCRALGVEVKFPEWMKGSSRVEEAKKKIVEEAKKKIHNLVSILQGGSKTEDKVSEDGVKALKEEAAKKVNDWRVQHGLKEVQMLSASAGAGYASPTTTQPTMPVVAQQQLTAKDVVASKDDMFKQGLIGSNGCNADTCTVEWCDNTEESVACDNLVLLQKFKEDSSQTKAHSDLAELSEEDSVVLQPPLVSTVWPRALEEFRFQTQTGGGTALKTGAGGKILEKVEQHPWHDDAEARTKVDLYEVKWFAKGEKCDSLLVPATWLEKMLPKGSVVKSRGRTGEYDLSGYEHDGTALLIVPNTRGKVLGSLTQDNGLLLYEVEWTLQGQESRVTTQVPPYLLEIQTGSSLPQFVIGDAVAKKEIMFKQGLITAIDAPKGGYTAADTCTVTVEWCNANSTEASVPCESLVLLQKAGQNAVCRNVDSLEKLSEKRSVSYKPLVTGSKAGAIPYRLEKLELQEGVGGTIECVTVPGSQSQSVTDQIVVLYTVNWGNDDLCIQVPGTWLQPLEFEPMDGQEKPQVQFRGTGKGCEGRLEKLAPGSNGLGEVQSVNPLEFRKPFTYRVKWYSASDPYEDFLDLEVPAACLQTPLTTALPTPPPTDHLYKELDDRADELHYEANPNDDALRYLVGLAATGSTAASVSPIPDPRTSYGTQMIEGSPLTAPVPETAGYSSAAESGYTTSSSSSGSPLAYSPTGTPPAPGPQGTGGIQSGDGPGRSHLAQRGSDSTEIQASLTIYANSAQNFSFEVNKWVEDLIGHTITQWIANFYARQEFITVKASQAEEIVAWMRNAAEKFQEYSKFLSVSSEWARRAEKNASEISRILKETHSQGRIDSELSEQMVKSVADWARSKKELDRLSKKSIQVGTKNWPWYEIVEKMHLEEKGVDHYSRLANHLLSSSTLSEEAASELVRLTQHAVSLIGNLRSVAYASMPQRSDMDKTYKTWRNAVSKDAVAIGLKWEEDATEQELKFFNDLPYLTSATGISSSPSGSVAQDQVAAGTPVPSATVPSPDPVLSVPPANASLSVAPVTPASVPAPQAPSTPVTPAPLAPLPVHQDPSARATSAPVTSPPGPSPHDSDSAPPDSPAAASASRGNSPVAGSVAVQPAARRIAADFDSV